MKKRSLRAVSVLPSMLVCWAAVMGAKASAQGYISGRMSFATGTKPAAIVTGDFNGDGRLDLAIANQQDNTVSILLGQPDGTLAAKVDYPTGASPISVTLGDFNGDGNLDLAVVTQADNAVSILLGNGDGTFQAYVAYLTGRNPHSIAAADFNHDGRLDLAVANADDSTISILLDNGDGTFMPRVDYATGPGPTVVVTGDFNGDGNLDLAFNNLSNSAGTFSILFGNGDGTFRPRVEYPAGGSVFSLLTGDFNQDGKLDLALVVRGSGPRIAILLGNGDGTFQPSIGVPSSGFPASVVTGDFNGDGKLDLAATDGASASIYLGRGNGTFQAPVSFNLSGGLLTTADFDADGKLDLAAADTVHNIVTILLGQGDGTFQNKAANPTSGFKVPTPRASSKSTSQNNTGPAVTLSPKSLTFPSQVARTTSAPETSKLTNTGNAPLTISSIVLAGEFAQTNNCPLSPATLAAGASCTISVTFKPLAAGPAIGVIVITDNASRVPQAITLTGTGSDFSMSITPTSNTVTAGQATSYTLSVSPVDGFNQAVSLTCTGVPAEATCSVSPSSVTLNGSTAAMATVTVTTTARSRVPTGHGAKPRPPRVVMPVRLVWVLWLMGLGMLAGLAAARRRRLRWAGVASLFLVLLLVAAAMPACGGTSFSGGHNPGTPAGNYTLIIFGTFTSGSVTLTHDARSTLTVH